MPFTFALNPQNHDVVIGRGGKLVLVTGAEEVRQRILVSLLHYWEEYFLNVPAGVPWYELILGSKDTKLAGSLIRRAVLDTPGVVGIANFQLGFSAEEARKIQLSMSVEVIGEPGPQIIDLVFTLLLLDNGVEIM